MTSEYTLTLIRASIRRPPRPTIHRDLASFTCLPSTVAPLPSHPQIDLVEAAAIFTVGPLVQGPTRRGAPDANAAAKPPWPAEGQGRCWLRPARQRQPAGDVAGGAGGQGGAQRPRGSRRGRCAALAVANRRLWQDSGGTARSWKAAPCGGNNF